MRKKTSSRTAAMVGENLVFMSHDAEIAPLLPRGAAEYTARFLVAAGASKPAFLALFRAPWFRRVGALYERMIAAGQTVHMALRKSFFDDETRAAIAAGATQVLMVGAGFDTLCARLALEHPNVRFVEVDHPGTQARKRAALSALGTVPENLHLLPADLAVEDLAEVLAASGRWEVTAKTVVVTEGLLMYLDPSSVRRLFAAAQRVTGPGSRLLLSYMKAPPPRASGAGALSSINDLLLAFKGEPYRWRAADGELERFLSDAGFRLDASGERCDLGRRYLEPAGLGRRPIGRVEFMAVGERT